MQTTDAQNWVDHYLITKNRKLLTEEQTLVPGLRLFAYQSMQKILPSLPPHFHQDAFEITYLVSGSFHYQIENGEYDAGGGEVIITQPNQIHSSNGESIMNNHQYWFQLDITDPERFLFLQKDAALRLINALRESDRVLVPINHNTVLPIVKRAFNAALLNKSPMLIASSIHLFLETMLADKDIAAISPDIQCAIEFIDTHLHEDISLEQVAHKSLLSLARFKQKFAQQVGKTPRAYINGKKIERAKQLLTETRNVSEVARALGYSNSSYFSTLFKKYTLYSPRAYLNRQNEKQKLADA